MSQLFDIKQRLNEKLRNKVKEIILGLIKEHDIESQNDISEHHNLKDDLGFDSIIWFIW